MVESRKKKNLRNQMLKTREILSESDVETGSKKICQQVMELPQWEQAERVLYYMPHRREIDLRPLMKQAWLMGKKVILPRAIPANRLLIFYQVDHLDELVLGAYGIWEPQSDEDRRIDPQELDLALVPGVAFDWKGYRLGYGGGYYDRFFAGPGAGIPRFGVGFSFQWVETVYPEAHDVPMNGVVVPTGLMVPEK
ncbi:5-formyltetrahydrofolate cyclo-ligase [Marininema mesophilum]|uniref:5-formyltetrahydrofolate cyclo-ligase n=1 Tax=Marininema mesophilum TaxID=1048340 RepID=A0A1H3CLJ1_9BACL|nr:5-formyltetrahydrofolate cyclo-ligase [Marininema mesophilum]SDX54299.1 5-formyltetrahydrofolate cyclo-ligase [Marininema mesophilum]